MISTLVHINNNNWRLTIFLGLVAEVKYLLVPFKNNTDNNGIHYAQEGET